MMSIEKEKEGRGQCKQEDYVNYLLSEPLRASCRRLGEILSISHDSVNRFLWREDYNAEDLFEETRGKIVLEGGVLSIDDTVIDKPYSKEKNFESFLGYYWSGKHKQVILGIKLITLYYKDTQGISVPINFRIYNKIDKKSKHDYLREMLAEVIAKGIKAKYVTGDSWYASTENLKFIKEAGLGFLFGVESNRKISLERGKEQQIQRTEIPPQGLNCYLPSFGEIKVFKQLFKEEYRYYIMYLPKSAELSQLNEQDFKTVHDAHWKIEQYHRVLKQVCNIESFQVRGERPIRNHFFSALCGYIKLALWEASGKIANCYKIQKTLFCEVIAKFIRDNARLSRA